MLCAAVLPSGVFAAPVAISFELVQRADPNVPVDAAAPLDQRLAWLLRRQLDAVGFSVTESTILGVLDLSPHSAQLASFCAVPLPKEIQTGAAQAHLSLDASSEVTLMLDDLRAMRLAITLNGSIHTAVPARVIWGQAVPFVGNCEKIGTDSGTVDVNLPFGLLLELDLSVIPSYDAEAVALVLEKQASIAGGIRFGAGSVTPKFGGVSLTDAVINAFEDYLLDSLRRSGQQSIDRRIQTLNYRLAGLDADGQPDLNTTPFNGRSVFPVVEDAADAAMARALLSELGLPRRLLDLLDSRGGEILLQILAADAAERKALLTALVLEVGCDSLSQTYGRALAQMPLYQLRGSACTAVDLGSSPPGTYYTDAECSTAVAFRATSDGEFCAARFGPEAEATLGNAAAWSADTDQPNDPLPVYPSRYWTSLLSTRLALGVVPIDTHYQPFVKQINFKTIETPKLGADPCHLEMRVYKKDIAATNLRPLLAIHGGTWRNRGFGYLGLEAGISQFTERGFVVFAPFYRLVGSSDGNAECNGATWAEVTEDVEDALQWVVDHGAAFGGTGKVAVFGQSAGAHLAAWLSTHKSPSVDRALLFYPPLDTLDFLEGAGPPGGRYEAFRDFGLDALARLYGARNGSAEVKLEQVDLRLTDVFDPPGNLAVQISDGAFDLTGLGMTTAPLYLSRCATTAGVDLSAIDLSFPPATLVDCLRRDLSDFLLENAFMHQIQAAAVPFNVVHGSADSLVPYAQAVEFCNAADNGARRPAVVGERVSYQCGTRSRATIVTGAQHALDLGLCVDTVCPAGMIGTPQRVATERSVRESYDWLVSAEGATQGPSEPVQAPDPEAPTVAKRGGSAGGGTADFHVLLVVLLGVLRRQRTGGAKYGP